MDEDEIGQPSKSKKQTTFESHFLTSQNITLNQPDEAKGWKESHLKESKNLWKLGHFKKVDIGQTWSFYSMPDNTENKLVTDKGNRQF